MAGDSGGLEALVQGLGRVSSYPHPVDEAEGVEVVHTHVSVVLLAGDFAYKIKKPVDFGFLDFTTLDLRRHFCHEEVRLNRRLAPDVYLGVVPIRKVAAGAYRVDREPGDVEADGERKNGSTENGGEAEGAPAPTDVVEYAVKMRRLPADGTMLDLLLRGGLTSEMTARVAQRIATFHREAPGGPEVSAHGSWRTVARNALENFRQTRDHVGRTVSPDVFERTYELTRGALRDHRELIEDRSRRGVPRDTHGDLHLDHVYFLPERAPPDDLVVIDCIEFNRRFRYGDPVADVAFLAMDLAFRGRRDLADLLVARYFRDREDEEGRALLPLYVAYRSMVRAKVRGFVADDGSVPLEKRREAGREARGHWLLALGELAPPVERPGLVLVGGLPGTGKSTLARGLAEAGGFAVISSDRVRKVLAGIDPEESAGAPFEDGLYAPDWTRRTYAACLRDAAHRLCRGRRVIVDATFREQAWRQRFLELGRRLGVRSLLLLCSAEPSVVRRRIDERGPGASDADWAVHRSVAERWEPLSPNARARAVDTGGRLEEAVADGLETLARAGLVPETARARRGA